MVFEFQKALKILLITFLLSLFFSCSKEKQTQAIDIQPLEISSWWTVEGENNALLVLQNQFLEENPDSSILNSYMAGGSGAIARKLLFERMGSGTPPDIFQILAGKGLINSSVKMGQVESLSFLYEEMDWLSLYEPDILKALSFDGDLYAVPLNIHRSNLIWYQPEVFNELNLEIPETMDELLVLCEVLANNGITPISLGDKLSWTALHIFENVLLSVLGADRFLDLWSGNLSFQDTEVVKAIEYFIRLIGYSNSDHSALSWDDALWNVVQGNGGITIVGDWADSNLISKGLERGTDYAWAVFPGTSGLYSWLADGFSLPKGAVQREEAIEWLRLCGSRKGQSIFNSLKSSLPARQDIDRSIFTEYQLSAYEDFKSSRLIGSVNHGVLISDDVWFLLLDIVGDLVIHRDLSLAQSSLENLRKEYLLSDV